jgi:hypothetical protein
LREVVHGAALQQVLRAKGSFWLATRVWRAGQLQKAGRYLAMGAGATWLAAIPKAEWPRGEQVDSYLARYWDDQVGDCRQELVFIGVNLDEAALRGALDACLLSVERRRAMIRGARRPGSMPDDVARNLRRAERWGLLRIVRGEVRRATLQPDGAVGLEVPGLTLRASRVLLATGFEQQRPGAGWLDRAIAACELPLASCGYPLVAPSLAWAPGLYVTGALAELELGPVARNIVGARHAGERLAVLARQT